MVERLWMQAVRRCGENRRVTSWYREDFRGRLRQTRQMQFFERNGLARRS